MTNPSFLLRCSVNSIKKDGKYYQRLFTELHFLFQYAMQHSMSVYDQLTEINTTNFKTLANLSLIF